MKTNAVFVPRSDPDVNTAKAAIAVTEGAKIIRAQAGLITVVRGLTLALGSFVANLPPETRRDTIAAIAEELNDIVDVNEKYAGMFMHEGSTQVM